MNLINEKGAEPLKSGPPVIVTVKQGQARQSELRFTDTFSIGRNDDNDLQITDSCVSRYHVKIIFEEDQWWVKDLESANGTYLNGVRIQYVPLPREAELELGNGGPVLSLIVEKEEIPEVQEEKIASETGKFSSETQIIKHYFDRSPAQEAGQQTMMFRRAFERIHKKRSKKYRIIILASLCLLLLAGGIIIYQKNKLSKLRNTAENLFYTMKSIELQIAQLEEIVLLNADSNQVADLRAKREKLKMMEKDYDNFVKELGIYKNMSEDERIIFRIARLFGECDVNMPKGFVNEVRNYINKWKSTDRLKTGISRANSKNYTPLIIKVMTENNLPPHFFFLALQESNFNDNAVGPETRYGFAKGIWQFISITANRYGLQVGPLYDKAVHDPFDDRFNFEKATAAAGRYLRDINNSEAQASGLLVMASYNWGENNIREIIRQMPGNPKERNFWRLLANKTIPQETYDYVFYIFSAAVICENPRLFGFDFDCSLSLKKEGR